MGFTEQCQRCKKYKELPNVGECEGCGNSCCSQCAKFGTCPEDKFLLWFMDLSEDVPLQDNILGSGK